MTATRYKYPYLQTSLTDHISNKHSMLHVTESRGESSGEEHDIVEGYFVGPRDLDHHSKWPAFLQLHGSVMPLMILPLFFVASWATAITVICIYVRNLGISSLLLTVLGFVVGLSLSFRSSTAYERYNDGRKYWAQLSLTTQNLTRLIWIHAEERPEFEKQDLLQKLTFCNMLAAYAFALKHRLRFEPFVHYRDLSSRIRHLHIVAHEAERVDLKPASNWKIAGWILGLPMADSNPRKLIKNPKKPLGNIPLEILSHCSSIIKTVIDNGTFKAPIYQTQAFTLMSQMNEVLTGTERVLNTPLPIAYSIAIAQITWAYILLLPFQLFSSLGWVTIPATTFSAYIILGIALIGREIEDPFGDGVNDLPLDNFCDQIRRDIDLIISRPPPKPEQFVKREDNALLHPLTSDGFFSLQEKSVEEIRGLLRSKPGLTLKERKAKSIFASEQLSRLMSGTQSISREEIWSPLKKLATKQDSSGGSEV